MNRDNLTRLADHLAALPETYNNFHMGSFYATKGHRYNPTLDMLEKERVWAMQNGGLCGAVACAVGHGPAIGLFLNDEEAVKGWGGRADWQSYSERVFTANTNEWLWCFSGDWEHVDNTVHGAAARIRYMLDRGVPEDFDGESTSTYYDCKELYA